MASLTDTRSSLRSLLLVISLLGLILISIFLSRRSVHDIQQASASIYKDRLVPTGILVNLTAMVYRKRLLMETYVLATQKPNRASVASTLELINRRIDSLLTEFTQTKLTVKETDQLQLLQQRLTVHDQIEGQLMAGMTDQPTTQLALFTGRGTTAFSQVAQTLDQLAALQLTVGEELLGDSRGQTNYIYILTALQIGLVLTIGLSLFWHRF
jgi:hypothetical protein